MRKLTIALVFVLGAALFAACTSDGTNHSETKVRDDSYSRLTKTEPAHGMNYSPTRKTINKWIDTWNVPGQLAFVYLKDSGKVTGYFVLNGPPVSECAALTPTYSFASTDKGDGTTAFEVPAPGVDGVYYSGGQCNQYYGIDASTGNYVEFSIGGTQNYELTTQPLPSTGSLPAAAFTTVNDVHKSGDKYVATPKP